MKKITVDGNEACAKTAYLFTELAGIYPITPSSPMAEHLDEWSQTKENIFHDHVKVVEMQSEAGAAGMIHGALQTGVLASTFTASQGLLLMIPNMYKMAGEMLPCVMHVAARSLSTHALSIFGDHQDIYATRQTGFCILASSSVQDASYLAGVAHLSAIECSLPFLHFFDGFRTSHELSKINVLDDHDYAEMLNKDALLKFRNRALNPKKPITRGTNQNDDIYFQATEVRNIFYNRVADSVSQYMQKINKKAKTNYQPFNYYGHEHAQNIVVAMGSVCETIKETIDALNNQGKKYGLIEVHLYRPFSSKYFLSIIPESVKKVAVLDRTKEPGSNGEPLYLDVLAVLKSKDITVVGGRYGLSGKNTTPRDIQAVFTMLDEHPVSNFTIGIIDDVTNLSLPNNPNFQISNSHEYLLYGYGSDGMVSASKNIISLVGELTEQYVQGYFQYDSKKSGGVTVSHLRFSNKPIRSTYYVENPELIAVCKDSYMKEFHILDSIRENGIFLLNTTRTKEEMNTFLPIDVKQIIQNRNIHFYIVNAYELSYKVGLKNKISTIMESIILYLSSLLEYRQAKEYIEKQIYHKFSKKGEEIVRANLDAVEKSITYLEKVELDHQNSYVRKPIDMCNIFDAMTKRVGNQLPTSAFLKYPDGSFEPGTTSKEKRGISDIVPKWVSQNCIQCNLCSFVCPHNVIRPFLLDEDEYKKAPLWIKERCIKPIEKKWEKYYYTVAISVKDCTGCGLCVQTCPGRKNEKALVIKDLISQIDSREQDIIDYLLSNITYKKEIESDTVKNSQFQESKFFFPGACSGCGEPAYIRLLTQLFGNRLMIANATGCSSIYGGCAPTTPYNIPWASSLFEDNAEYGYGMLIATNTIRNRIANILKQYQDSQNQEYINAFLENMNDFEITQKVYEKLDYHILPDEINELKEYIPSRTIWTIGGDGWAYDIGFGGIDHILASNDNVNILVLDTQVYSNTGGQSSKASPKGSIASFTTSGKNQNKKDLARIAMSYSHVYVAQVNLGANPNQLLKALKEATAYNGPSLVIAYAPCISHGIKGGMENSIKIQKEATDCGYFPLFRYHPTLEKFYLDSKNVDFNQYHDFLMKQTRYSMLYKINPEKAMELLKDNMENAKKRFLYYQSLCEQ